VTVVNVAVVKTGVVVSVRMRLCELTEHVGENNTPTPIITTSTSTDFHLPNQVLLEDEEDDKEVKALYPGQVIEYATVVGMTNK